MIDGKWTTEEIVQTYENGVMRKIWPKLYEAVTKIAHDYHKDMEYESQLNRKFE